MNKLTSIKLAEEYVLYDAGGVEGEALTQDEIDARERAFIAGFDARGEEIKKWNEKWEKIEREFYLKNDELEAQLADAVRDRDEFREKRDELRRNVDTYFDALKKLEDKNRTIAENGVIMFLENEKLRAVLAECCYCGDAHYRSTESCAACKALGK